MHRGLKAAAHLMAYPGVLPVRFERTLSGTSCLCFCQLSDGSPVPRPGFEPGEFCILSAATLPICPAGLEI